MVGMVAVVQLTIPCLSQSAQPSAGAAPPNGLIIWYKVGHWFELYWAIVKLPRPQQEEVVMSDEKPSPPQAPSLEQSAPAQNRSTVVVDPQKNAIGKVGFLCSAVALVALISFLPVVFSRFVFLLPFSYSFLVLFPLSFLLSLIGVFYRPRDCAIAGLVISVGVGGPLLALLGLIEVNGIQYTDQQEAAIRKEIAQNTAAYDEIKKSPAFQAACEKIENSPAVQAKIGAPVKLSG